jgi:hypothetical protein
MLIACAVFGYCMNTVKYQSLKSFILDGKHANLGRFRKKWKQGIVKCSEHIYEKQENSYT